MSEQKTTVFRTGGVGDAPCIVFLDALNGGVTPVVHGKVKRWLGWMWDPEGGCDATLRRRIVSACAAFARLGGYVLAGAIPLPLAIALFHAKVMAPWPWPGLFTAYRQVRLLS